MIIALTVLVAGCFSPSETVQVVSTPTPSSDAPRALFPRTVVDASQVPLVLAAPPQRIVSLSPGATEALFAIGAGPRVVAVDLFSDTPEAARALAKVDYSRPNPEQVIALRPDLVLMSGRQRDQVQRFRELGLPVVYLGEPATLDAVLDNIALIAKATGHDEAAATLLRTLTQRLDAVRAKVADVTSGPRVFFELSPALHTAGPSSFIGSMLSTLKAQNIATTATQFPQLSAEALIAADPQVVLLADVASAKVDPASIGRRPGWAGVSAVRNGRVHEVDADATNRPGPRIVDAVEAIARLLYPERFPR